MRAQKQGHTALIGRRSPRMKPDGKGSGGGSRSDFPLKSRVPKRESWPWKGQNPFCPPSIGVSRPRDQR